MVHVSYVVILLSGKMDTNIQKNDKDPAPILSETNVVLSRKELRGTE